MVLAGIAGLLVIVSRFVVVFPDVECLYTEAWSRPAGGGVLNSAALLIRRAHQGSGVFLLTQDVRAEVLAFNPQGGGIVPLAPSVPYQVYRYDSHSRQLFMVPRETWDQASSEITDCRSQSNRPIKGVRRINDTLRVDGTEVKTAGAFVLDSTVSPSGEKVAVLSAAGPKDFSGILPFLSGWGYWGPHYHQTLDLDPRSIRS